MRAHARPWGVRKRLVLTRRVGSTEPWVVRREAEARASPSLQQPLSLQGHPWDSSLGQSCCSLQQGANRQPTGGLNNRRV